MPQYCFPILCFRPKLLINSRESCFLSSLTRFFSRYPANSSHNTQFPLNSCQFYYLSLCDEMPNRSRSRQKAGEHLPLSPSSDRNGTSHGSFFAATLNKLRKCARDEVHKAPGRSASHFLPSEPNLWNFPCVTGART